MSEHIKKATLELLRRAATTLPSDIMNTLARAYENEESDAAKMNLKVILDNVRIAGEQSLPMCQDTGAPIFWIHYPRSYSQAELRRKMNEAVRVASQIPYLRPNAVDSITGKNSGDNIGAGVPVYHFEEWDENYLKVELMLKGGGSENVSPQYKLPDSSLGGGRNLEGVRRCVIDAVFKAQGLGCAPGVIGVAIGGNRDTAYAAAKKALMRPFDDQNSMPELNELEQRLLKELNELGIGPMGFGGKTTVLAVKAVALHRLPACFFVSIAYNCWALRRQTMIIKGGEVSYD
ncbi:MAG: fumarate hydratase [Candidatus Thermoplasmatota archaeon]|jgi:fumarate hydratase class I|nr:fumarate hydratase [Candidatus Thermoplasmatota archaeon]MDP7264646.1 fumarate hydratase [Candidatus Thermoplasmatota archaeon]